MRRMTGLVLGLLIVSGVLAASALAAAPQNTQAPTISGKEMVGQTLTADKDNTIRVQVTAKNLVGSTTANSDVTAVVTGGTPTPTPTPTPVGVGGAISITAVSLPNRLIISQISFTPRVIHNRRDTITARF